MLFPLSPLILNFCTPNSQIFLSFFPEGSEEGQPNHLFSTGWGITIATVLTTTTTGFDIAHYNVKVILHPILYSNNKTTL